MSKDLVTDFRNVEYVFLDRDGVVNRNLSDGRFVTRWEEFHILPGVEEAIAALNRSRRKVIVVTNQRGVALGLLSRDDLDRLHNRLRQQLAVKGGHLDAVYVCPHDNGECDCRKPQTGLFEQAFRDFPDAHAANSVMIGDSPRDIEAGMRLGMPTVLIAGAHDSVTSDGQPSAAMAQGSATSLLDFVQRYLHEGQPV
jgi:D-glycero-D-manno-heptose 1,7-bisphosphate phosphatase